MSNDSLDSNPPDYRGSHASAGYGDCYQKTYQEGYYAELWRQIERPLLQEIFTRQKESGAISCLDFACGTGRITQVAEGVFPSTLGVDVSESMLAVAGRNCRRARFLVRDITRESLDEKFDVVTAFRFFLNAGPELRNEALAALRGCLASTGTIIINVHVNRSSVLGIAYRIRNRLTGKVTANVLGLEEMKALLEAHGLTVSRVHWYGYYPRTGWRLGFLSRWLMRPVDWTFSFLRFLPRRWAQSFIIEARHCA